MDNIQKFQDYIKSTKPIDLAKDLDYVLETGFDNIDPDFKFFYMQTINRIRERDDFHQQLNYLKYIENKNNEYKKKSKQYDTLVSHQEDLLKMYISWKQDNTIKKYNADMEEFYINNKENISRLLTKDAGKLTLNLIKKLIRNARGEAKERYRLKKPVCCFSYVDIERFEKDKVYLPLSTKKNFELLAELGEQALILLAINAVKALNNTTDDLRVCLIFEVAHAVSSKTKGKEYARTDKQTIKDPSKTLHKPIQEYIEEYNTLLEKLQKELPKKT